MVMGVGDIVRLSSLNIDFNMYVIDDSMAYAKWIIILFRE